MRNAALTLSRPRPRAGRGLILVRDFIVDYTVLVFAYLVAIYLRQEIPFGKYVGANYQWQEPPHQRQGPASSRYSRLPRGVNYPITLLLCNINEVCLNASTLA